MSKHGIGHEIEDNRMINSIQTPSPKDLEKNEFSFEEQLDHIL